MQRLGRVADDEMYRAFNMGVGMVVVVASDKTGPLRGPPRRRGVESSTGSAASSRGSATWSMPEPNLPRVAILISGRGSNMGRWSKRCATGADRRHACHRDLERTGGAGLLAAAGSGDRNRGRRSHGGQAAGGPRARDRSRCSKSDASIRVPRRLHAASVPVVRRRVQRADPERPPGAAPGVPRLGRTAGRAGATASRCPGARSTSWTPRSITVRSSSRLPFPCSTTTPRRASPRAFSRSSTRSTRRRSTFWPRGAWKSKAAAFGSADSAYDARRLDLS